MTLWLLTTLVATCGQKGPLYLPEEPQEAGPDSVFSASSSNARRLKP